MNTRNLVKMLASNDIASHVVNKISFPDLVTLCLTNIELHQSYQRLLDTYLGDPYTILHYLSSIPIPEMHKFVAYIFQRPDSQYLQDLHIRSNHANAAPAHLVCYALVTNDIHKLTMEQLTTASKWLAQANQHCYRFSKPCIDGILAILKDLVRENNNELSYFGTFLNCLGTDNYYLNFSSAKLDLTCFCKENGDELNLSYTNFSYASMRSTYFSNVNLTSANLSHADLSAFFHETDEDRDRLCISTKFFPGTNLSQANLTNANLSYSLDWEHVTLTNANLSNARLIYSDIIKFAYPDPGALASKSGNFIDILYDAITIMPVDFDTALLTGIKLLPNETFISSDTLINKLNEIATLLKSTPTHGYLVKIASKGFFNILRKIVADDLIQSIKMLYLPIDDKRSLLNAASQHPFFKPGRLESTSAYINSFFYTAQAQPKSGYQLLIAAIEELDKINQYDLTMTLVPR